LETAIKAKNLGGFYCLKVVVLLFHLLEAQLALTPFFFFSLTATCHCLVVEKGDHRRQGVARGRRQRDWQGSPAACEEGRSKSGLDFSKQKLLCTALLDYCDGSEAVGYRLEDLVIW